MPYVPYFPPIAIGSLNWGGPLNAALAEIDSAQTTNPRDHDLIQWQFDLASNMVATAITSGTVNMSKLWIRQPVTITNVCVAIGTVGAALVAGQNFAGLYDQAGTRLGQTADQTANWGTTGSKQMALTAPVAIATPGAYYVAVLSNAGTTPAFARGSALTASIPNFNLTATNGRFTTGPAGQTTLPASITMAARTLTGNALWVGVS
jgi:hypothetical protein